MSLADQTCIPCQGGMSPLSPEAIVPLAEQTPEWTVIDNHHLQRDYTFPDFRSALAFVVKVGEVAEEQGHHPDIAFGWGKVSLTFYTHKIDGLAEADFVMAAKVDGL